MPKTDERLSADRIRDGKIARALGWTGFKIKCIRRVAHDPNDVVYVLVGTPPRPPFEQVKVPCWNSQMDEAVKLADMFGLETRKIKSGYIVRPKAAFHANPYLDSGSAEGFFDGPTAITSAVLAQLRGAVID